MFSVVSLPWETLLGVNFHMGIRFLHRSDVVIAIQTKSVLVFLAAAAKKTLKYLPRTMYTEARLM